MALPQEVTVGVSLMIYQMMLLQAVRRRRLLYRIQRLRDVDFSRRQRIRRFYERQSQERMLFMMMLSAWAYASSATDRRIWVLPRRSDWWDKIVKETFSDRQWEDHFRIGKETFQYLLAELLPSLSRNDTKLRRSIPAEKRLAITLWRLASGKDYAVISQMFGISKASISGIIKEVCEAIVQILMPEYVKVPSGDTLKAVLEEFESKWGFPQCAGALGNTHILIPAPSENTSDYLNNCGQYSAVLQGIVDSSYKFWDLNIGWPGSVPVSRVLTNSSLWEKGQAGSLFPDWVRKIEGVDLPILILANTAYPLADWVMKPYHDMDPIPKDMQKFNDHFNYAYSACETAFKRLKARWRCLAMRYESSLDTLPNFVAACCTLHNMCELHKEPVYDEWIAELEQLSQEYIPIPTSVVVGDQADDIRLALTKYFSE